MSCHRQLGGDRSDRSGGQPVEWGCSTRFNAPWINNRSSAPWTDWSSTSSWFGRMFWTNPSDDQFPCLSKFRESSLIFPAAVYFFMLNSSSLRMPRLECSRGRPGRGGMSGLECHATLTAVPFSRWFVRSRCWAFRRSAGVAEEMRQGIRKDGCGAVRGGCFAEFGGAMHIGVQSSPQQRRAKPCAPFVLRSPLRIGRKHRVKTG